MIYLNLKRDGDMVFAAELCVGDSRPVARCFGAGEVRPYDTWTPADKTALQDELIEVCKQSYPEILEGQA